MESMALVLRVIKNVFAPVSYTHLDVYKRQALEETAFLVVPGVAFDINRHRAGYGQGFYDRYLSQHPKHKTVAVAFEFQIVEEVPAEVTDIFPQKVVTEARVIE